MIIQSNIFHYGMEDEATFPLIKEGNTFKYDTTQGAWPNNPKEFQLPIDDTLRLKIWDGNHLFVIKKFKKKEENLNKNGEFMEFWDISE